MTHDHATHAAPTAPDPRDLVGPFHHAIEIAVRFSDTDARGHVNNAVYLTYCEMGRIRYWTDVTGETFTSVAEDAESLILAEARIVYRAQTFYGETVTVQTRATRIGRSSFTLEHRLLAAPPGREPRLVALGDSVLVQYDYAALKATPLTDEQVASIEAFEARPLRS